jgi:hypothetical protein
MVNRFIMIADLHQGTPRMFWLPTCRFLATLMLAAGLSPGTVTRGRFTASMVVFGQLTFYPLQAFGQLGDLPVGPANRARNSVFSCSSWVRKYR